MKLSIDTNILVYAASSTGDETKHLQALSILDRAGRARNSIIPLQALQEFAAVVLRKKIVPADAIHTYVTAFMAEFPTAVTTGEDLLSAIQAQHDHGLPIWDALIWAVSRRAGADLLLSEDFQDGRVLGGVRFLNPFNAGNAALINSAITP